MLYLITNRRIAPKGKYFDNIKASIQAGVDAIIVREKDLSTIELRAIVDKIKRFIEKCAFKKVYLIINSNEKVAIELDADGLHLGFKDFIMSDKDFSGLIGVSVHSIEEAIISEKNGADYILAGHVFPTKCKEGLSGRGLDFIKAIKEKVSIPVIALGGINHENAQKVVKQGADGIAVMSYIMSSHNAYERTSIIKSKI